MKTSQTPDPNASGLRELTLTLYPKRDARQVAADCWHLASANWRLSDAATKRGAAAVAHLMSIAQNGVTQPIHLNIQRNIFGRRWVIISVVVSSSEWLSKQTTRSMSAVRGDTPEFNVSTSTPKDQETTTTIWTQIFD